MESLVVTSRLETGNSRTFFLRCTVFPSQITFILTYLHTCVMIPIGPSRAPWGMSRPVSSRSLSGILSRLVSSLGRVASRMSPVACFEAPSIHTVLNLTGQIVPFFTDKCIQTVSFWANPGYYSISKPNNFQVYPNIQILG
jgi:hypothetical protein